MLAKKYASGKTQIQHIIKNKIQIKECYLYNSKDNRKRFKYNTGYHEINSLLWKWFNDSIKRMVPISGKMLKDQALKFAQELGIESFKASNGWLDSFCKRNNINFGVLSGESAQVDQHVIEDWKSKIPYLIEGYSPEDVYNFDESGLFFKSTTNKSFKIKGSKTFGGKDYKNRITLAFLTNMAGETEPLLVIGKNKKPRCFKNIGLKTLKIKYYFNKKAWMTTNIFEDFMKNFNEKLKKTK